MIFWLLFLSKVYVLGDEIKSPYLRELESLQKKALFSQDHLEKQKASPQQEEELRRVLLGGNFKVPIRLEALIEALGWPQRIFIPPISSGESQPFISWEYKKKGNGLVRFKVRLRTDEQLRFQDRLAEAYEKDPRNSSDEEFFKIPWLRQGDEK